MDDALSAQGCHDFTVVALAFSWVLGAKMWREDLVEVWELVAIQY